MTAQPTRPQLVAPSTRETPPQSVADILNSAATSGRLAAVATKFLPPDRLLRLAIAAVRKTPLLAQCDPATFMGALMSASLLGLEPNTPQGLAYLIPYKNRRQVRGEWRDVYECQFQTGYRGFIDLMYRQPYIVEVQAEAVRAGDTFEAEKGTNTFLRHKKALVSRGEIIGAYCYTRLKDGQSFTVLDLEAILKARSKSETFNALNRRLDEAQSDADRKKAQTKLDETPWVMWEDDMAAKTAIKKHGKSLRLAPDVQLAIDLDGGPGVTVDMRSMADPDFAKGARDGVETVATPEPESEPAQVEHKPEPQVGQAQQQPQQAEPAPRQGRPAKVRPQPQAQQAPPPAEGDDPGPEDDGGDDGQGQPEPPRQQPAAKPAAGKPKDMF